MGKHKATLGAQLADTDLKLLRIFKAVVDNGGITAAEDELNIATSTISNYLSSLEQRLAMRLCQRGRKGFALTEQGSIVYAAILELLDAIELFQGRIKGGQDRLVGSLRLALAEGICSYPNSQIPQLLEAFSSDASEVYMDVQVLTAEEVTRAVLDERIAIGVSYLTNIPAGLECYPLHEEQPLLYCGKKHPLYSRPDSEISAKDIEKCRFVETPRLRRALELKPQVESFYFQAYAPNMEARVLLLQTGNFIAYLPKEYVVLHGLEKELRPLLAETFFYKNSFYAITRKGAKLSPVEEHFIAHLKRLPDSGL